MKTLMPTAPGPTREHVRDRATVLATILAQRTRTAIARVRSVNPSPTGAPRARAIANPEAQPTERSHGRPLMCKPGTSGLIHRPMRALHSTRYRSEAQCLGAAPPRRQALRAQRHPQRPARWGGGRWGRCAQRPQQTPLRRRCGPVANPLRTHCAQWVRNGSQWVRNGVQRPPQRPHRTRCVLRRATLEPRDAPRWQNLGLTGVALRR